MHDVVPEVNSYTILDGKGTVSIRLNLSNKKVEVVFKTDIVPEIVAFMDPLSAIDYANDMIRAANMLLEKKEPPFVKPPDDQETDR
ncbi:MAG TPA: hypothetical protein VF905_01705 [Nitrospirota bacterium]